MPWANRVAQQRDVTLPIEIVFRQKTGKFNQRGINVYQGNRSIATASRFRYPGGNDDKEHSVRLVNDRICYYNNSRI